MIEKLDTMRAYENNIMVVFDKINEIIDFLNRLPLTSPPKRYYKEDYGYRYEVDEFGNPVIPAGGPR